jgi:hypothetical protein
MKSILVNQEIDRRNLEDLVSIRRFNFIGQIAAATVVALLRVVIFDFTALRGINKFSRMTGMAGLTASLSSGSLAASTALGLSARIRRGWLGGIGRIAAQFFLQILVFFLQPGKLLLLLGKLLSLLGKLLPQLLDPLTQLLKDPPCL